MTNFIVIDLNKLFKLGYEEYLVTNYYKSIGVPIPTESDSVPFLETENYESVLVFMRTCRRVSKIWVNPDNGFIIAYEDRKGYCFSEKFTNHLVNIESSEISEEIINSTEEYTDNTIEMSTDSILDKISKYGIDSLTKEEKSYLDAQ